MAKMDDDFLQALRHEMLPAGAPSASGIDRLTMLLTDTQTIRRRDPVPAAAAGKKEMNPRR